MEELVVLRKISRNRKMLEKLAMTEKVTDIYSISRDKECKSTLQQQKILSTLQSREVERKNILPNKETVKIMVSTIGKGSKESLISITAVSSRKINKFRFSEV